MTDFIEIDPLQMQIPVCCRENWDSCPHCIQKPKKQKRNVGL